VRKHYDSGNMQKLQKRLHGEGRRLAHGFLERERQAGLRRRRRPDAWIASQKAAPTALLMDPTVSSATSTGAKTTPHMFVIDQKGALAYRGAIDDKASTDVDDIKGAKNYVAAALISCLPETEVAINRIEPYGCGVKYAD